jgi:type IV fimbrial biogenesis protein FimT
MQQRNSNMVSRSMRAARGFTMIELVVVVSIIAILGAVAAPSFITTLATQRLRNASFDLVSDLLLARGEALKLQANVDVQPSALNGTEWTGGWTVTSPNGTVTSRAGVPPNVRFVPLDSSGNAVGTLTFGGTNGGRLTTAATPVRITVKSSDLASSKWTCISLDATGRARADKGSCT